MICSVDGCDGTNISARGLCRFHYRRSLAGKELVLKPAAKNRRKWLFDHIAHDGDDCLIWPFARDKNGRGFVGTGGRKGKNREAARFMCELAHGAPPDQALQAAHSCGKAHLGCVNPKHLRWATRAENEADKVIHGTSNQGSRHGMAKLTEAQAIEIRRLAHILPHKTVGAMFGVSRRTAGRIASGERWSHV